MAKSKQDIMNELYHMRMSIKAIRDAVNLQLDALAQQIEEMIPEDRKRKRPPIRDWKKEVAGW